MPRRRAPTLLTATGLLVAAGAANAAPAAAELRTVTAILAGGSRVTLVVDVPPGVPVDQVPLPGLFEPVVRVIDRGPAPAATPSPTATPSPAPSATAAPTATPTPASPAREKEAARRRRAKPDAEVAPAPAATATPAPTPAATATPVPPAATPAPSAALGQPGAASLAVPSFLIDSFRIPPFLLPIYQAAGSEYGVRWEVLAAINEIETDFGRNAGVSSAGAVGWMQFLPSTWEAYGVDANDDGVRDPANPVDAIFAAARYLRAAGAETDLRGAIFAYNHADWYVQDVLARAERIAALPANLVASLTGITQGRFPVRGRAGYARQDAGRQTLGIRARRGAAVVAVNDAQVIGMGRSARLGAYLRLRDVYGNVYTYGDLGERVRRYPALRADAPSADASAPAPPAREAAPSAPASATAKAAKRVPAGRDAGAGPGAAPAAVVEPAAVKERLFAHPERPRAQAAGGDAQLFEATGEVDGAPAALGPLAGVARKDLVLRSLRRGARVPAGTVLGRVARTGSSAGRLTFEIRPGSPRAARVDPAPILDGWRLLESTAAHRTRGRSAVFGADARTPTIGQLLLMSKEALIRHVLADRRVTIYDGGRADIAAGVIDRRVLATLAVLTASGLHPTVSSLRSGHAYLTKSGNVSHHSSGHAVDISAINGVPILGHQGARSVTEQAIQRVLTLQGSLQPDQIISLMTIPGAANTFAMGDHDDHIHLGWRPVGATGSAAERRADAVLAPGQWEELADRLGAIPNPRVRTQPSRHAVEDAG